MKLKSCLAGAAGLLLISDIAFAATSASWLSPPNNSHFAAGSTQTVTGQAAGSGQTGGSGLDLILVMDASGSMGGNIVTQRNAAHALVAGLPQATTSVGIVSFTSGATTRIGLTQLDGTNTAVTSAINSFSSGGGTSIHAGVNTANTVLGSAAATASRLQAMVVMSDGGSSVSSADSAADTAMASNTEAVHSVGMGSGHSAGALQAVVNGVDDNYGTADDYGSYVGTSFANLLGLFSGTGGNLVGLDHIDLTTPDGVTHANYALDDGFGNFSVDWTLAVGANVFTVDAVGDDGTTASATWTLYGDDNGQAPEPASILLLGLGLLGLRRMQKS
ncbi:MAG: VWA domain-containing protein [Pseudomonadales bacterium]|nr:VWA domain-containing protein [Pseudomonadales bacterium]